MSPPPYAELQVTTNYSFLRGASHPQELVLAACMLGYRAMAITDRNSLAGVVRGLMQMKELESQAQARGEELGFRYIVGARLDFEDGTPSVLAYPTERESYGRLARMISRGKLRTDGKGQCRLSFADLLQDGEGLVLMVVPPKRLDAGFEADLTRIAAAFPNNVYLAASRDYAARDIARLHRIDQLARISGAPMVATNDVLYAIPQRRPLQDVLTCIREKTTIHEAGLKLQANAERHLKTPEEMARLFARFPEAIARTVEVAERCRFDLRSLRYEYPHEPTPKGRTHDGQLARLTLRGARWRYPQGVPDHVRGLIRKELAYIRQYGLPQYFLTVHDLVQFARHRGILCQGRGSAANSAVCYCLGITAVDPQDGIALFERFLSADRDEPPDIDVDFEHERREEVMQYVYGRFGRERAAICATVIHYRPRSAIRDVGKALGLTEDVTAALADTVWGSFGSGLPDEHVRQAGFDPGNPQIEQAVAMAHQIMEFPRHLSQHVGGFVLTERRLDETVPIGPAAMEDRTFIEWDKDDIDELGLMKVDVLALGMLTALKRSFDLLVKHHPDKIQDIAEVPKEESGVYRMLSKADSVGVFQVESRAQMSMLPRLRPREFYDLVIEVAIVRPGPIQGDMVHPYLRRRQGLEPVEYPSPDPRFGRADELEQVLKKTLGVPLFQEQAMKLAMVAAEFTGAEANGLRHSMATFRNHGGVEKYRDRFVGRMIARGYDPEFAGRCFSQIEGFGSYGFPESHAASFAKLVYASAWVKWRWPDVFLAALLNSQPMGFYQPAQLVRDAREHDVEVRGVDVGHSEWDSTLEPASDPASRLMAVRLGFRQVRGLAELDVERLIAARAAGAREVADLAAGGVSTRALTLLAEADAFRSMGLNRREALWAVKGLDRVAAKAKVEAQAPLLALMGARAEPKVALPAMRKGEEVTEDYRTVGLSLKAHPCAFFRTRMQEMGVVRASDLGSVRPGRRLAVAGLVLIRQRPGTAKGVTFITLEDETGVINLVLWNDRFQANRRVAMTSPYLLVKGVLERADGVTHVVVETLQDLGGWLQELREPTQPATRLRSNVTGQLIRSRDFH
jgi:error-prone DNA polymerase